jgi:hypothetical protein
MKAYNILVEIAIHIRDILTYDINLALIRSLCLKFLLTFNVNEVTKPQVSLIILDGITGSHSQVKHKNTQQSTIVPIVDKIRYKKAYFASFFAFMYMCLPLSFS